MNLNTAILTIVCWTALVFGAEAGALKLASPFTDRAVLQRDRRVPVWGTAPAGIVVTVRFGDQTRTATATAEGVWRTDLEPMPACAVGRELTVSASGARICVRDVLVGEVWFASGQSNMACPIVGNDPHFRDAEGALVTQLVRRDSVRYVMTPEVWRVSPTNEVRAVWRKLVPESFTGSVLHLSAVAYYFAKELNDALGVPVGIVDCAWGGSAIDAWIPREALAARPDLKDVHDLPVKQNWTWADHYGPIINNMMQPTVLWNGMVNAYAPYAMRGVIWYQGERNREEPRRYASKMHALYDGWSTKFENPEMPLYFVQLANFRQNWYGLWLAQARFAQEEPHAGMAVCSDIGAYDDIHPQRKEPVARRLAALALKRTYGFTSLHAESPEPDGWSVDGDTLTVRIRKCERLCIRNEAVSDFSAPFELAGADGVFRPARVVNLRSFKENGQRRTYGNLEGRCIVLKAEGVPHPERLRYLFAAPRRASVFNEAGLPLGAFQINAPELEDVCIEEKVK